jgi:hypothetical protein
MKLRYPKEGIALLIGGKVFPNSIPLVEESDGLHIDNLSSHYNPVDEDFLTDWLGYTKSQVDLVKSEWKHLLLIPRPEVINSKYDYFRSNLMRVYSDLENGGITGLTVEKHYFINASNNFNFLELGNFSNMNGLDAEYGYIHSHAVESVYNYAVIESNGVTNIHSIEDEVPYPEVLSDENFIKYLKAVYGDSHHFVCGLHETIESAQAQVDNLAEFM